MVSCGALSATPPSDDARRATERFEALLDRCERLRAGGLPFDELGELGRRYRAHTARLARLRERDDDPAEIRYLNALCVRAYSFLYVPPASERSLRTFVLERLPDALLHLYAGILLGAFAAIFCRAPLPLDFLAWILPHGIPELTAITLCAAAGLCLGGAVAAPGRQGRRRALREAVNPALLLFAGSIPLFALAALAESFVRESALGTAPRLGIAAVFAAGLVAALLSVRRFSRRVPVDAAWLGELIAPVRGGSPGSGSAPRP